MPKPIPTLHDPMVMLKADMSRDDVSEFQIPPHFTNIQHALQMARRVLANPGHPNRQMILITDGLPTAHFEGSSSTCCIRRTRAPRATMREGPALPARRHHDQHVPRAKLVAIGGGHPLRLSPGRVDEGPTTSTASGSLFHRRAAIWRIALLCRVGLIEAVASGRSCIR
jgi:hypothetical protein